MMYTHCWDRVTYLHYAGKWHSGADDKHVKLDIPPSSSSLSSRNIVTLVYMLGLHGLNNKESRMQLQQPVEFIVGNRLRRLERNQSHSALIFLFLPSRLQLHKQPKVSLWSTPPLSMKCHPPWQYIQATMHAHSFKTVA